MKTVVLPAIVTVIMGTLIGVGVNATRATGKKINVSRDYFKTVEVDRPETGDSGKEPAVSAESEGLPAHDFIPISLDEVIDLYQSDGYYTGDIVFVDARDEEHYEEQRIPGSLHLYHYSADVMFENIEPDLEAATTVVVYCAGGQCEDSILLAGFLLESGVPYEKIRLFEGGMNAWLSEELDTVSGPREVQ
jgi:rhodanese-related sulfurtransferase